MHEHALTIKTVRDGPVCALILRGGLDPGQTDGFLGQAVAAVGNRAGRLVLDPAGVTFPGCAGVPAAATAASFAPRGYPVIIRSLSPRRTPDPRATGPGRTPHPASRPGATNHDPNLGWATSPEDLPRREPGRIREPREVRQMRAGRSPFEVVSGVPVVTAPKEIDIATAPALRSALLTAAVQGTGHSCWT